MINKTSRAFKKSKHPLSAESSRHTKPVSGLSAVSVVSAAVRVQRFPKFSDDPFFGVLL